MLRKKLSVVFFLILLAAISRTAICSQDESFEVVPIWIHVHQKLAGDDGNSPAADTVAYLKSQGYKGIIFTPHARNISFSEYKAGVDVLNAPDFVVVSGRELSVDSERNEDGKVLCHVNAVSDSSAPAVMDASPFMDDLPGLFDALRDENAAYIWNHPWSCEKWMPFSALFQGIEFFNDFGPGHEEGLTYEFDRTAYLNALKQGARPFVVSGIDMHVMSQTVFGEFTTYVFPDEFTPGSMIQALHGGHVIAAFNARLFGLNRRPSVVSVPVAGGAYEIKGAVGVKPFNGFKPSLTIYRDGVEYTPPSAPLFVRREKKSKGYTVYDFSFTLAPAPSESSCYVFEVPHYLISSPYCVAAE